MYKQVDKPKENKSRAVANSVAQQKSGDGKYIGFIDNRVKGKGLINKDAKGGSNNLTSRGRELTREEQPIQRAVQFSNRFRQAVNPHQNTLENMLRAIDGYPALEQDAGFELRFVKTSVRNADGDPAATVHVNRNARSLKVMVDFDGQGWDLTQPRYVGRAFQSISHEVDLHVMRTYRRHQNNQNINVDANGYFEHVAFVTTFFTPAEANQANINVLNSDFGTGINTAQATTAILNDLNINNPQTIRGYLNELRRDLKNHITYVERRESRITATPRTSEFSARIDGELSRMIDKKIDALIVHYRPHL